MALLSPLLTEISTAFPGIEVRVFRGPPVDIGEKLKSGDVELAIAGPLGDEWERFEARKLFEEQFGALLARGHPLSRLNGIQLPVLLTERLLCLPHCEMTERLTARLQSLGAQKIAKHEAPLVDDLLDLVRANFGVGILPMGRRIPDDLCIREVEGVDLRRWIHVLTVAGRPRSIGAATLVKLLRAKDWSAITRTEDRTAERPQ
jgi:DNA-binding transcriptional LysR family regulator